jgi:transcriptional regulator with XRE-family HTH domain
LTPWSHSYTPLEKESCLPTPPKTEALSKKEIGGRVRALRQQQRLTQADLATILGTHQTAVSQIEIGNRGLSLQQVVKLAHALHAPLDEILGAARTASPRNGRVKDRDLRRRLEKIEKLSKRQKQALLLTLDNFLKGAGVS